MRQTSVEAFNKIKETGLLSKRRWQVYEWLYYHGPATARQVSNAIAGAWKRVSELEQVGLVAETGKTKCSHTGQTVTLWDVTAALPVKPEKQAKVCNRCIALQNRVEELEAELAPLRAAIRIVPRPAVSVSAHALANAGART
jgi:hypothetical protein